jgi:hypothetical protein
LKIKKNKFYFPFSKKHGKNHGRYIGLFFRKKIFFFGFKKRRKKEESEKNGVLLSDDEIKKEIAAYLNRENSYLGFLSHIIYFACAKLNMKRRFSSIPKKTTVGSFKESKGKTMRTILSK